MTKKDLVERAVKPPSIRISQAWGGYERYPIRFNYQRVILESLEVLSRGVDEILGYIQEKERKKKL